MSHDKLDRLRKISGEFGKKSILVIGDLMLDRYFWGSVSRISPEAPVPIVELSGESTRLGGAANVASNVVSFGARAGIFGVVGEDEQGSFLVSELKGCGIDAATVLSDASRPTTVKTRIIAHSQQVVRTDREVRGDVGPSLEERLIGLLRDAIRACDAVVVSDYGKGVLTEKVLKFVTGEARSLGLPVCVDPKETKLLSYVGVTVVTPNQHEAGFAYGKRIVDDVTLEEVGWGLSKRLGCEGILITRGEKGMSLFEKGGVLTHFPTVAREVFDVTGAGDTVVTALALALAGGATLKEAASISNHAAGLVIRHLGTATTNVEELMTSFLENGQWCGW
ncbi:MAG: D-glycero-beta-D-manno-heptose-7-phosphate kinase [Candidatus Eisenbacteria bacterium]